MFRFSHLAIVISSDDGRIVDVNQATLVLLGFEREEMLGQTSAGLGLYDPDARARNFESLRTQGYLRDLELSIKMKSGDFRHVITSVSRIEMAGQVRYVTSFLDITERRRTEETLRTSEEKYRRLVESTHDAITISDGEGLISFVNRQMAELIRYEPSELIGKSAFELIDPEFGDYAKQLYERWSQGFAGSGEIKLRRKDGTAAWVVVASTPILEGGRFMGALSTAVDITERKQVEARLERSEALLREAQEVANIGSWDLDLRTGIVTRSPQMNRILGLSPEEVAAGSGVQLDRTHPEDRERARVELERCIRERGPLRLDIRIVRPDGVRHVHMEGGLVCNDLGAPVRVVGVAHDVTEKRENQARLLLSNRMSSVGTLAAGVAHEINNPLAAVTANLEMIAEEIRELAGGSPSPRLKELEEMTNEARQGAERVRKIVRGLKTFSRADEERRATLDVRQVLELSINMAINEIRHRARLVRDYGETPLIEADEARLGQVFINLLVNAAQAIPEGHADKNEIRIVTQTNHAGHVVVQVRDSGGGIAEDTLPRIFDPFFTTKAIGEGTGLGLTICHNIVTALGGEITAESQPGKGTVFQVVIPPARLEPPLGQEVKPARSMRPTPAVRRGRVLVVDDDAMVGNVLRRILGTDHDVTVLPDGNDALDLLISGKSFDVILCDLMMPNMTGMELYEELSRALPEMVDRMVFVTGGAFTPAARAFLDAVPNQRVEKPFAPPNLRALVRGLIGYRAHADGNEPDVPGADVIGIAPAR